MNAHTKKEKEFVRKLVKVLRSKGIQVSESRLSTFVDEYAPTPTEPSKEPEIILGRVNANMRLLWALCTYFEEESMCLESNSENEKVWLAAWRKSSDSFKTYNLAVSEIAELCADAFWTLLMERFGENVNFKTHCFVLKSDWSIHAIALTSIPPLPGRLEKVLWRIEGQLIVSHIATK